MARALALACGLFAGAMAVSAAVVAKAQDGVVCIAGCGNEMTARAVCEAGCLADGTASDAAEDGPAVHKISSEAIDAPSPTPMQYSAAPIAQHEAAPPAGHAEKLKAKLFNAAAKELHGNLSPLKY